MAKPLTQTVTVTVTHTGDPRPPDNRALCQLGEVVMADGEADVYGMDNPGSGLMVNHASGRAVWDVLFELARATGMAVMPVGCRSSVTDAELIDALSAVSPPAAVVTSGADILATMEEP